MKKLFIAIAMVAMLLSANANAFWGGNNNGGYNNSDWPVWTPMYWMEEMEDEFDNNNWGGNGNNWGGNGNGWNNGYGAPYGGGYGAPNGGGYGAPYGGGYNGGGYGMPYGNPAYYPYSNGYPAAPAPVAPAAQ